jgi:hypothetical protein
LAIPHSKVQRSEAFTVGRIYVHTGPDELAYRRCIARSSGFVDALRSGSRYGLKKQDNKSD